MLVKYCDECIGKPYTKDFTLERCPVCNAYLKSELVDEESLKNRSEIKFDVTPRNTDKRFDDIPFVPNDSTDIVPESTEVFPVAATSKKEETALNAEKGMVTIQGRVSQYSSTGKEDGEYRRLFFVKAFDAIVYRQRLEDVLHRFTVKVQEKSDNFGHINYTEIPVNVHGTIAGGLQLRDNLEVEVHGKYRNSILMADSIYVINNGNRSKLSFQRSVKAISYSILLAVMLVFICFVAAISDGAFFSNLKSFCTVWLVFDVILTVLCLIAKFSRWGIIIDVVSRKKRKLPWIGILIASLALTFLFVSVFGSFAGFGNFLSGWIYAIVSLIIVVVALFWVVKSIFI